MCTPPGDCPLGGALAADSARQTCQTLAFRTRRSLQQSSITPSVVQFVRSWLRATPSLNFTAPFKSASLWEVMARVQQKERPCRILDKSGQGEPNASTL